MAQSTPSSPSERDLTPAEADAELLRLAGEEQIEVRYVTAAGHHEPDGTPIVERRKDRARRDALLREWDRFDSLSPSEQQAYVVLGRKRERTGPPAIIRRMPAARPAARRPRRRSGASSSRAGPGDDGPGEPPPPGPALRSRATYTFGFREQGREAGR